MTTAVAPRVLAWDGPTRLFKWTLVLLVADAWVSDKFGAATPMWHKWNGYAILVLIVFRVLWGVFGGSTARFSEFVRPWKALPYALHMFSVPGKRYLGHNPVGGLMVVVLLLACFLQACLGLFSADSDHIAILGPFAAKVTEETSDAATHWHRVGFNVILGLVTLHVLAVSFYEVVKRQPLVRAMMSGRKPAAAYEDEPQATPGSPLVALACLVAAIVLVFGTIAAFGGNVLR